jgi:hypothetical protein
LIVLSTICRRIGKTKVSEIGNQRGSKKEQKGVLGWEVEKTLELWYYSMPSPVVAAPFSDLSPLGSPVRAK